MVSRYLRRYPSIRRSRWDRKTGLFGFVSALGAATSNGNLRQVRKIDRAGGSALQRVGHLLPQRIVG